MKKLKYIAPILIAIACFGLQQAKADQFIFNLTNPNPAVSQFTGPYVKVTIDRSDSTHATINFLSLQNTFNGNPVTYLMGDGSSVAVNVNATLWTLGAPTGLNTGTGFTPGAYSNGNSGQVDGFGVFNQTINTFDGYTHSSSSITFALTGGAGTNWTDAMHVLVANSNGAFAASHIFPASFPAFANNDVYTGLTGYVANGGSVNTPDGGTTVMLLGAALGVLGMARRFIRS